MANKNITLIFAGICSMLLAILDNQITGAKIDYFQVVVLAYLITLFVLINDK